MRRTSVRGTNYRKLPDSTALSEDLTLDVRTTASGYRDDFEHGGTSAISTKTLVESPEWDNQFDKSFQAENCSLATGLKSTHDNTGHYQSHPTVRSASASTTVVSAQQSSGSSTLDKGEDETFWPPYKEGRQRTLVLCFDGTGDQFDDDNSNIVRIFQLLKKNDPKLQLCYYQAGVGTYTAPSDHVHGPIGRYLSGKLDSAIACYLHTHVQDGYEFLMQNYEVGDKICLFGFSRGAYTARALAGMVHSIGLLPRWNTQQIPFAWKYYIDGSPMGLSKASEFKAAFSINVIIDFIGVFDTVASVGIMSRELPFARSNNAVRVFRHALALDERRIKFKVNHSHDPPEDEAAMENWNIAHYYTGSLTRRDAKAGKEPDPDKKRRRETTNRMEVWFAGCHGDVGGGSVKNKEDHNLAMIPLRWMIQEAVKMETGILFDLAQLHLIGLNLRESTSPDAQSPKLVADSIEVPPQLKDIEERRWKDAVEKKFDQLVHAWAWWILEIWPLKTKSINDKRQFRLGDLRPNLGRGRHIPNPEIHELYIHKSVKYRMENYELVTPPGHKESRRKKQPYVPEAYWVDARHRRRALNLKNLPNKTHWVE
ncbi:hypothetical protein SISSUDRAFT_1059081 [Sistotremastrum suecicum HHB10207 ss-3]|uniref:T6SS Phospholipase effector Tle1-like catalytic domain-containing protein n=1 Tax=Sistotremastrum suecicum HHB10207 ss-3 TaxID=1314776 RepID=A0A166GKC1_9AGAM|nr:hypothetical protein SISSUDRAFT_1059081 [Sistotremastrum suecicum HHB10207 ss-3]